MKNFILPVIVFLGALSGPLGAQTAPCGTNTLAFYDSPGRTCVLGESNGGILEFSGFSFSALDVTGTPTLLTDSQIEVTPDPVGEGGGFTFTATGGPGFAVGIGQAASYEIDYSFFLLTDPFGSGANIGMDPVTGNVGINETVCVDDNDTCPTFGVSSLNPPSTVCTLPNLTAPCWENSLPLDILRNASISNAIDLNGSPNSGASFDDLTAIYTVTDSSSTPEPLTSVLGLGGLVAIGLFRRYGRHRWNVH
jgi:hypothetical protein